VHTNVPGLQAKGLPGRTMAALDRVFSRTWFKVLLLFFLIFNFSFLV
jgi:hypothetical protein